MKLNDPFGRMERKHQAGYESMRTTLRNSGVNSPEAAREIISKSKDRIYKAVGVAVLLGLLLMLALPKTMPVVVCLVVLVLVFCFNSLVNGKRYIERYIAEELEGATKGEGNSS